MSQLELFAPASTERPFHFVVVCARCGRAHAAIPVEDGNWNAAEKWAYLAHVAHRNAGCARMYAHASTTPTPTPEGA